MRPAAEPGEATRTTKAQARGEELAGSLENRPPEEGTRKAGGDSSPRLKLRASALAIGESRLLAIAQALSHVTGAFQQPPGC
jgi:hypothetical protein